MKKVIPIIAISIAAIVCFLLPAQGNTEEDSPIYKIVTESQRIIQAKYNLKPVYYKITMPGKHLQKLSLAFNTNSVLTLEQFEPLLVEAAKEVGRLVNYHPEASTFLNELFTISKVEIIIYNLDANGNKVYDPEIGQVRITDGKLCFAIDDRFTKPSDKKKRSEPTIDIPNDENEIIIFN